MVFNPDLGILCCQICQIALAPDHVSGHLDSTHPLLKVNIDLFKQLTVSLMIASTLPSSVAGGSHCPPYKGLKVYEGIACGSCIFTCASKEWMGKHHRQKHSSITTPREWRSCKMQQLNKGANKQFWRVAEDEEPPFIHQEAIDGMRREMAEAIRIEQISGDAPDKRTVSPWLLTTKWHEHVAGHDTATLRKLVEIPKFNDADMPHLRDAVEGYFREALKLIDVTDELVLQRLNTPDPVKG